VITRAKPPVTAIVIGLVIGVLLILATAIVAGKQIRRIRRNRTNTDNSQAPCRDNHGQIIEMETFNNGQQEQIEPLPNQNEGIVSPPPSQEIKQPQPDPLTTQNNEEFILPSTSHWARDPVTLNLVEMGGSVTSTSKNANIIKVTDAIKDLEAIFGNEKNDHPYSSTVSVRNNK
jgi:hypothetical protein